VYEPIDIICYFKGIKEKKEEKWQQERIPPGHRTDPAQTVLRGTPGEPIPIGIMTKTAPLTGVPIHPHPGVMTNGPGIIQTNTRGGLLPDTLPVPDTVGDGITNTGAGGRTGITGRPAAAVITADLPPAAAGRIPGGRTPGDRLLPERERPPTVTAGETTRAAAKEEENVPYGSKRGFTSSSFC